MKRPRIWHCLAASLLLVLFLAVGCKNTPPQGEVRGTVRYQKKALPSGTVEFHCADHQTKAASIGSDGTYRIKEMPVGTVRISVISHPRIPSGFNPGRTSGGEAVLIPDRYKKSETSGLTYEVHQGDQMHDIDLEP